MGYPAVIGCRAVAGCHHKKKGEEVGRSRKKCREKKKVAGKVAGCDAKKRKRGKLRKKCQGAAAQDYRLRTESILWSKNGEGLRLRIPDSGWKVSAHLRKSTPAQGKKDTTKQERSVKKSLRLPARRPSADMRAELVSGFMGGGGAKLQGFSLGDRAGACAYNFRHFSPHCFRGGQLFGNSEQLGGAAG